MSRVSHSEVLSPVRRRRLPVQGWVGDRNCPSLSRRVAGQATNFATVRSRSGGSNGFDMNSNLRSPVFNHSKSGAELRSPVMSRILQVGSLRQISAAILIPPTSGKFTSTMASSDSGGQFQSVLTRVSYRRNIAGLFEHPGQRFSDTGFVINDQD